MIEIIRGQLIYFWYYFDLQFRQIFVYWLLGILIGSGISVFAKVRINHLFERLISKDFGLIDLLIASILGIMSPLCMYGTIPIAASFAKKGMKEELLASFMMSSILLNPQLLIYSGALGTTAMMIRLNVAILARFIAGILIRILFTKKSFFNFTGFDLPASRDNDPNVFMRYLKNVGRNIKATGWYFLLGIILTVLFQMYVPQELFANLFFNQGFGLLMATTLGVPVYVCGGGTIPLLNDWLHRGMSLGSATAFMITGPATKLTNLGALKIVLGGRHFIYYLVYIIAFALIAGSLIDVMGITIG